MRRYKKGLTPKTNTPHKGGRFQLVSQKWLNQPRVIPQPCTQFLPSGPSPLFNSELWRVQTGGLEGSHPFFPGHLWSELGALNIGQLDVPFFSGHLRSLGKSLARSEIRSDGAAGLQQQLPRRPGLEAQRHAPGRGACGAPKKGTKSPWSFWEGLFCERSLVGSWQRLTITSLETFAISTGVGHHTCGIMSITFEGALFCM